MKESSLKFHVGPLWFDGTTCLMVFLTCLIVFFLVFVCSRNMQLKPKGKQNALEWIVDFVRNILSGNLPSKEVNEYHLLGFTLFLFILVSNVIGLVTKVVVGNDVSVWKSPTADPFVTLTLSFTMILLTNLYGMKKYGIKGYFVNSFAKPAAFLIPIKFMEEFTNVLTLGLRLYGNIYAGEILLSLIAKFALSFGALSFIFALPLEMIWQGFSLFIGGIQAFVFVTLSMVYLSHKIEEE